MKTTLLLLFTLLSLSHTQAQTTIRGQVTDSLTHEPLAAATVTLQRGNDSRIIDYAVTDAEGRFSLRVRDTQDLSASATYLGYKRKTLSVHSNKELLFKLSSESISLKEVIIQGGRISTRQDTVKYDLARFASSKDSNVKDILKKLPGIDVDENTGKISYQGKAISHFYVEGMDVTGGSYNQVNENLKADAVESAEIIEHHQPIRSLRNKVPTENVALNLKLKTEARSKWLWNTSLGLGHGEEVLYNARLNALQLAKSKQGIYTYKADRSGNDLTTELQQLTQDETFHTDQVPSLVTPPTFSMPLEKHRLMDNDTHLLSLNRLYRKDDIHQTRFALRYLHDEQQREQGSDEIYYYTDTIRTHNEQHHRSRTDQLRADWDYEQNKEHSFTRNLLTLKGEWTDALSRMSGDYDLSQRIGTDKLEVENRFNTLYNKEKVTWGIRSYTHYVYLPSTLKFGEVRQALDAYQTYTDNQFYYLRKRNGFGFEFTGGMNGRLTFLLQRKMFEGHRLQVYAQPCFSLERSGFRVGVTPGVEWEHHPQQGVSKWYFQPKFSLRHRINQRWTVQAYASLNHQTDVPGSFYTTPYYTDYRTLVHPKAVLSSALQQNYMLYGEYKRPINEFFWTMTLFHFNRLEDYMSHSEYSNKQFLLTSLRHRNHTETYQAKSILSKGFYDWNLKTSLETTYNYTSGKQAGQGSIRSYRSQWIGIKPHISWSPNGWMDVSYQATLNCSRTDFADGSRLPALWDIRQRLNLGLGNERFSLNLTGEHYYNELTATESKHTWLADASCQYHLGRKWKLEARIHNLFNQKAYRYTIYSETASYTSWIKMRSREILCKLQFQW